jgi:hypothetical protein
MSSITATRQLPADRLYDAIRNRPRAQTLWATYAGPGCKADRVNIRIDLPREEAEAAYDPMLRHLMFHMQWPEQFPKESIDPLCLYFDLSFGRWPPAELFRYICEEGSLADALEAVLEKCAVVWPVDISEAEVDAHFAEACAEEAKENECMVPQFHHLAEREPMSRV